MKIILTLLCTVFLSTAIVSKSMAQQNSWISGTITEANTNIPLPGATVFIKEYSLGTVTDYNGAYNLKNVPAGKHLVRISYLGYKNQELEIETEAGQKKQLNIVLESDVENLEEVVVTTQVKGQIGAINQQLSADQMKNVVSAERIKDVPDANASESIARLPGISLRRDGGEGTNVNIRGLSPEFNKITINGVTVPSTGENTRSSDLSMISSENLSGIEVFKSITPDMDGDAIGGTVNMKIAKAKDTPERYARAYGGYNVQENDYRQYKASGRWSQRILKKKIGIQASFNTEKKNRSSEGLTAGYELGAISNTGKIPLLLNNVRLNDFEEYRVRSGGNIILDYSVNENLEFMLLNTYNSTNRNVFERTFSFDKDNSYPTSVIANPEHNLNLLSNALSSEYNAGFAKFEWTLSRSKIVSEKLHDNAVDFRHYGAQMPLGVDYETISPIDLISSVVPDSNSNIYQPRYEDNKVNELNYMADMNITIPYRLGEMLTGEMKFGGRLKLNNRDRISNVPALDLQVGQLRFPITDYFDNNYDQGNFLDGQTNFDILLDPSKTNDFYNQYSSIYSDSEFARETYTTEDQIGATYLMTKLKYGKIITLIPGIRYEQFNGTYTGEYKFQTGFRTGVTEDTTTNIVHKDWLPMVNMIVRPTDWFNVRLAVTKTLVRPSYNDLIPRLFLDLNQSNDGVDQGNPDLQPTRSWNYDAYLTFNHKYIGLFTIGGFYKDLKGVIIDVERRISSVRELDSLGLSNPFYVFQGRNLSYIDRQVTRPENTGNSNVKGVELEWQTNLRYLPSPFNGVVLSANYTRLWSKTNYSYFLVENVYDPTRRPPFYQKYTTGLREGRVRGQSDHIINFSVGYDFKGFSSRVSMTYQGESLNSVSTQAERDRYNNGWVRWDLTIKQNIGKHISIYFNGSNLNNQYDSGHQGYDSRPTELEYYGEQLELGLQVNF